MSSINWVAVGKVALVWLGIVVGCAVVVGLVNWLGIAGFLTLITWVVGGVAVIVLSATLYVFFADKY
jgi:hypothetical protein